MNTVKPERAWAWAALSMRNNQIVKVKITSSGEFWLDDHEVSPAKLYELLMQSESAQQTAGHREPTNTDSETPDIFQSMFHVNFH